MYIIWHSNVQTNLFTRCDIYIQHCLQEKSLNLKQAYSEWVHYQKTVGCLSGPKAVMKHIIIQCSEVRLQSGSTDVLM